MDSHFKRAVSFAVTAMIMATSAIPALSASGNGETQTDKVTVVDGNLVLEAENASKDADCTVKDTSSGSGGECVFVKNGTIEFSVPAAVEAAEYTFDVVARYPFGYKENYVNVNDGYLSTIKGSNGSWTAHTLTATLGGGDTIQVDTSWGWFELDCIVVKSIKLFGRHSNSRNDNDCVFRNNNHNDKYNYS